MADAASLRRHKEAQAGVRPHVGAGGKGHVRSQGRGALVHSGRSVRPSPRLWASVGGHRGSVHLNADHLGDPAEVGIVGEERGSMPLGD
jgi:hypothetical protein